MTTCDKCGQATRTIHPYLRKQMSAEEAFDVDRPIPRSALAVLDPEGEAALPWGEHPDDNAFGQMCASCHSRETRARQLA